jgi:hypothetical protein
MIVVRIGISKLLFGSKAAGRRLEARRAGAANGKGAARRAQRPQRAVKRNRSVGTAACVIKARKRRNSSPHGA